MEMFHIILGIQAILLVAGQNLPSENGRSDNRGKPLCCSKLPDGSFSDNCQRTKLWAGSTEGHATSPNFPGKFPILKKCIWEIYTRRNRRIRIDFRDFYLIGPGDNGVCYSQHVIIRSPLSGLQVGPHCGNAGIPGVVTAGNYVVVELISNIPMTSENFRGFRMSFRETTESPGRGLASQNSKKDVEIPEEFGNKILDDASNGDFPTKTELRATTKRPWRVQFGAPPPMLSSLPVQPKPNLPETKEDSKSSSSISPMVIVGIAAGGIVLVALTVTFGMTALNRRRRKRKGDLNQTKFSNCHPSVISKTSSSAQPIAEYYVYYYEDPHSLSAEQKQRSYSREKERTQRKSGRRENGRKVDLDLDTISKAIPDEIYRGESPVHSIKASKIRKSASIAPPLSINPSNRRAPGPERSKSLTKLKEPSVVVDRIDSLQTEQWEHRSRPASKTRSARQG